MDVTMLRSFAGIWLFATATGIAAQDVDESALDALDKTSIAAVQQVREPAGAAELRAAIRRISYNSGDADALADAGNASLALGDANAALNFFTRANGLRPNNGRIVAGLATATVRTENPFEALRLFDDAIRLGISDRTIAADRALAFDLLGNFARAQQDYKLARTAATSDDLMIRQAISLSLAGQKEDADAMLLPLLQKNSAAAWRARAFMLAARGDFRESTKVTQGFMDAGSAQKMERYLRLMPELTAAQQAAAIHLGHFPASQYVGRDSDQLRRVASAIPPVAPGAGESRLIPAGDPLGRKDVKTAVPKKVKAVKNAKRDKKSATREERIAQIPTGTWIALGTTDGAARSGVAQPSSIARTVPQIEPAPAINARVTSNSTAITLPKTVENPAPTPAPAAIAAMSTPSVGSSVTPSQAVSLNAVTETTGVAPTAVIAEMSDAPAGGPIAVSVPTVVATTQSASAPTTFAAIQGPTLDGSSVANAALSAPAPVAAPVAVPTQQAPAVSATPAFDLASIVSAIEIPESEQTPSAVPVDLTKLKPAAPKVAAVDLSKGAKSDPKLAAKAKAEPANPARFWVQIATGDANALGYDYRKWSKKSADLFKGQTGWTSAWGKTDRLLVGPFTDMKAAKKWEADFKKAGGDGFMWKSENGVAVTALKSK